MTTIVPRNLDVDFSRVPRNWLYGNATATAVANGVNLLFPWGERFFVRSVNHYADQIEDPALKQQIKAFFKQEGHHAKAHDEFNQILRDQGYEVDRFLGSYKRIAGWVEQRMPRKVNLAITAASEHFTAILAEGAFTRGVFDAAAPEMRQLLAWHAAEEIEHKAVAYDVLQKIDPSYALRVTGLALATGLLGGFWMWGAIALMRQDGLGVGTVRRDLGKQGKANPIVRRVFLRGIRQYLRRDFHPNDNDDATLARDWFAAHDMKLPEAA